MPGLVGLTRWGEIEELSGSRPGGRQTIHFYKELLGELSESAAIAVMAHELAHAWLNEHVNPSASALREKEADDLAVSWGFGTELKALEDETEPF